MKGLRAQSVPRMLIDPNALDPSSLDCSSSYSYISAPSHAVSYSGANLAALTTTGSSGNG